MESMLEDGKLSIIGMKLKELRHAYKKAKEKWLRIESKPFFCSDVVGLSATWRMMDEKTVRMHFQTWGSGGVDALKQTL